MDLGVSLGRVDLGLKPDARDLPQEAIAEQAFAMETLELARLENAAQTQIKAAKCPDVAFIYEL